MSVYQTVTNFPVPAKAKGFPQVAVHIDDILWIRVVSGRTGDLEARVKVYDTCDFNWTPEQFADFARDLMSLSDSITRASRTESVVRRIANRMLGRE